MYVRLVHPQPRPGQAEEYARRWKEFLAPRARAMPGFRDAYFIRDPATDRVNAIFIWDEKPGEDLDRAMDDFRQHCADITTGPALRQDLIVLAQS